MCLFSAVDARGEVYILNRQRTASDVHTTHSWVVVDFTVLKWSEVVGATSSEGFLVLVMRVGRNPYTSFDI